MKKAGKILGLILVLMLAFLTGWRVMPRIWPKIKTNVVYPLLPQLKPEESPVITPEPYLPHSDSTFGDAVYSDDSVIYYFYKDYCPYCRELEPLTAGLPSEIILSDGTVSKVKFFCLNKVEEKYAEIISDYYQEYDIPEEKQYVPAIVIGDHYLYLGSEIIDQLMDLLVSGEGLKTPLLDGTERVVS